MYTLTFLVDLSILLCYKLNELYSNYHTHKSKHIVKYDKI